MSEQQDKTEGQPKAQWGGRRPNQTGRPRLDPNGLQRRKRTFYVTDQERIELQNKLQTIRGRDDGSDK